MKSDQERIKELEDKIWDLESTYTGYGGTKYARRDHPRWNNQNGNPYLPLDENGNMRKGYVG